MAIERIEAPTAGVDLRSGLSSMGRKSALWLENFLVDEPGRITLRGALGTPTTVWNGGTADLDRPTGVFVHGSKFLITGGQLDSRYCDTDPTGVSVSTVTLPTVNRRLDGRSVRAGAYAFGPAIGSSPLLRWDGTASTPVGVTNAPQGSADVAFHLQRLVVAGGSAPGTASPLKPNALYWTDQLDAQTCDVLTDWKDDVSGLVNQLLVGSESDPIVGLASLPRQLVVFKQDSIWVVQGDSPSTWSVRKIASRQGCQSKLSVLAIDDACVFLGTDGWMLYDGAQLVSLAGTGPTWRSAAAGTANVVSVARVSRDHVACYGPRPPEEQPYFWLLHLPTRSWTAWSADSAVVYNLHAKWLVQTEDGEPWLFDDWSLLWLGKLASNNWEDRLGVDPRRAAAGNTPIVGTWKTRAAALGSPSRLAVVQRAMLDHLLVVQSAGSGAAWTIALNDSDSATPLATLDPVLCISSLVAPAGYYRQHASRDVFVEAADAILTITHAGEGDFTWRSELHDAWLEYEPAQR